MARTKPAVINRQRKQTNTHKNARSDMLRMSPSDAQDAACSAHPTSSGQWNFRSSSVDMKMRPVQPTRPAQVSGISGAASDENTPSAVCLRPPDAGITSWLCGEVRQCIHQSRAKHLPGSPRRGIPGWQSNCNNHLIKC